MERLDNNDDDMIDRNFTYKAMRYVKSYESFESLETVLSLKVERYGKNNRMVTLSPKKSFESLKSLEKNLG